jgi:hypothetical protein
MHMGPIPDAVLEAEMFVLAPLPPGARVPIGKNARGIGDMHDAVQGIIGVTADFTSCPASS